MNQEFFKVLDCGVGCGTAIIKDKTVLRIGIYPCEDKPCALIVDLLARGQLVSSRNK